MKIQYIGHSCFLLKSQQGTQLIIDPPETHKTPNVFADILLVSHHHPDHNNTALVMGASEIITGSGDKTSAGIPIYGFMADHGEYQGQWLGMVVCYRWEMDGLTCLHLSDIAKIPEDYEIKEWGKIDILFIPVGGTYTLTGEQARILTDKLNPAVVIPMHYATPGMDRIKYPLNSVDDFLDEFKKRDRDIKYKRELKYIREPEIKVNLQTLPKKGEIWILSPLL